MQSSSAAEDHHRAGPPRLRKYFATANASAFDDGHHVFSTPHFWNASTWTQVTSDNALVDQLLQLYFHQETGHRVLLAASPFLENMQSKRTEYCNSALVNAVLSLACTLDLNDAIFPSRQDRLAAGDAFCLESDWHLTQSSHTLMDIQALGTLSMRELAIGNDILGANLADRSVTLAFELGCHQGLPCNQSSNTANLNMHLHSLATFLICYIHYMMTCAAIDASPCLNTIQPVDDVHREPALIPYFVSQIDHVCSETLAPRLRESLYDEIAVAFEGFELSLLIRDNLIVFYKSLNPLSQDDVLRLFAAYQGWYDALPPNLTIRDTSPERVLLLHCQYYFAILLLFRPFYKVRLAQDDTSPRTRCANAAAMISDILGALELRGLIRQAVPVACVFYFSVANLLFVTLMPSFEARVHLQRNIKIMGSLRSWSVTMTPALRNLMLLTARFSLTLDEASMTILQNAAKDVIDGPRIFAGHNNAVERVLVFMDNHIQDSLGSSTAAPDTTAVPSESDLLMAERGFIWSPPSDQDGEVDRPF